MNAFFDSQFNYCPLIWMWHNRKLYYKINQLHEKCWCLIYNDKISSYEELSKDGSVFMHHKNLQKLVLEIYKVISGLCHEIINEAFQFQIQNHHNLRNYSTFRIPSFNTFFREKASVSYLGPKIWNQLPDEMKSLEKKKWVPPKCQCRLCRIFSNGIGFIS